MDTDEILFFIFRSGFIRVHPWLTCIRWGHVASNPVLLPEQQARFFG
jgi:hypothetical protein